jgi:uncharacterized membrane protein (GlpM family)
MSDIFLIKIVLSFLVGGTWVTAATLLADKHGTKIGGLITGLPSTALISLFFIGWTQSPAAATEATTIIPLIGAVNALFLLVYISLVKKNFWIALSSSLLFWGLSSSIIIFLKFNNFYLSLIIYFVVVFVSFSIIEKGIKVKSETGRKIMNTLGAMIFRGIFSGLIIALAVVMGKVGGPLLGGMFAMFPAMFTGTLLITFFTHGPLFSSAMMKVALISAISVVLYAVLVRTSYIPLGLLGGTLVSIAVSFAAAGLLHIFIVKKIS